MSFDSLRASEREREKRDEEAKKIEGNDLLPSCKRQHVSEEF